ncbi:MAG: 50S ribosomal protein L28 [Verrucomicrobiae bacterium]|nr:50S ribosomal protein L28 [Verrucomicrobiae bacterium]
MARQCQITQAKPVKGSSIIRSGKAKKKGGIGMHVTANTPRNFFPNLKNKKIYVPELKRYVSVKLTARALKTVTRHGAYNTLKKAGII